MSYESSAYAGVEALRKWVKENNITKLPSDPWKLPPECPIWHMDLSAFQAGWCLAQVRKDM